MIFMLFLTQLYPRMWSPVCMKVNGVEQKFPIPGYKEEDYTFPNGAGMQYEAESVRQCIIAG